MSTPVPKMTDAEIQAALPSVPEWSELNGAIQRTLQFPNFVDAMRVVNKVAEEAERANHHPDILVRYNKVTFTLSTHDSGGITAKDFALAATIDRLAPPPPPPPPPPPTSPTLAAPSAAGAPASKSRSKKAK
ncbi:MAG: 4a-hydroxytetrahydrobiopterin dehydratase [Phycisphaerae bacterium]|nr:4a-hydroxytetrahydrobiopterin dehydratase [Phycisphaerae bacterium]